MFGEIAFWIQLLFLAVTFLLTFPHHSYSVPFITEPLIFLLSCNIQVAHFNRFVCLLTILVILHGLMRNKLIRFIIARKTLEVATLKFVACLCWCMITIDLQSLDLRLSNVRLNSYTDLTSPNSWIIHSMVDCDALCTYFFLKPGNLLVGVHIVTCPLLNNDLVF